MSDTEEKVEERDPEAAEEKTSLEAAREPSGGPQAASDDGDEAAAVVPDEVDVEQAMAEEELPAALDDDGPAESADVDDTPREGLLDTIEALTFVSSEPMTVAKVREVYGLESIDVPAPEVKRAFKELLQRWTDPARPLARGLTLIETGGGIRFRTEAKTGSVVRRMFTERPQRLSRAALETLAIIGYRQPLTRPQIDEIRGVDSSGALKALMDRRLVRVLGKADDVGRPLLYGTTKTFLEFFGLTSLRDLPTLKQIQELDDSSLRPLLQNEARAAVVMDLFDPQKDRLVSDETDAESIEALHALEAALGQATEVARRSGPGKGEPPMRANVSPASQHDDDEDDAADDEGMSVDDAGPERAAVEPAAVDDDVDERAAVGEAPEALAAGDEKEQEAVDDLDDEAEEQTADS